MVLEEHSECHTPRKHVIGGQIHTESACAGGSLCIGRFDASYKSLIGLKRKIGIDGQVIADALLRASDLKNGVEIGDLVADTPGGGGSCADPAWCCGRLHGHRQPPDR